MRLRAILCAAVLTVSSISLITLRARAATPGEAAKAVAVRPGGDLSADELASVLGVHVWKLDVSLPADAKAVHVALHQQAKGKPREGFGSGIETPLAADAKRQLLIAIVPIGGTLNEAEKVRVTLIGFGMVSGRTQDNPLRNMGIGKPQSPEAAGYGTFHLIGGYAGNTVSSPIAGADHVVSLRIESR